MSADEDKPWMPDCVCGRDAAFFRHESHCPLRYWHEVAALDLENHELRAEVANLKKRLVAQESDDAAS